MTLSCYLCVSLPGCGLGNGLIKLQRRYALIQRWQITRSIVRFEKSISTILTGLRNHYVWNKTIISSVLDERVFRPYPHFKSS